jgi:hypothetical protein
MVKGILFPTIFVINRCSVIHFFFFTHHCHKIEEQASLFHTSLNSSSPGEAVLFRHSILEIFKFWHEKGFTADKDKVMFCMTYISETKDIDQDKLKKILEESSINGGDIMPTLAQRLREEGMQMGIEKGMQQGMQKGMQKGIQKGIQKGMQQGKQEGWQEAKIETAKQMLLDKMSIKVVAKYTGLKEKELKALLQNNKPQ